MPSIQDVADQINAKLDAINTSTSQTAALAQDIRAQLIQANSRLDAVHGTLQDGLANLSQGVFLMTELQKVSNQLLDHNREQNDTLICLGENANEMLCGITRKFSRQLEVSNASLELLRRLDGVISRAHAAAAADHDRHAALQARLEVCCPPKEKPPEPCPEDCEKPTFKPRDPKGSDWKPLPTPDPRDRRGGE